MADDGSPWDVLRRAFDAGRPFAEVLPVLSTQGLAGEDLSILLNSPTVPLRQWMQRPVEGVVSLEASAPPEGSPLVPPRRAAKRGFFGWLSGGPPADGVGLFTEAEVFEQRGVQFALASDALEPVAVARPVPLRIVLFNATTAPREVSLQLEAAPGVLQGPSRYTLRLPSGAVCLAVLPLTLCPLDEAVVRVLPLFEVDEEEPAGRPWRFEARPYGKPLSDAVVLLVAASAVAAATGLTSHVRVPSGPLNEGSPSPARFRPDLKAPLGGPPLEPVLWVVHRYGG